MRGIGRLGLTYIYTIDTVCKIDKGFPAALVVKNPPANIEGTRKRNGFYSWVDKIPWKRAWQPTPVFLPGKFHGQRSLAGYSP